MSRRVSVRHDREIQLNKMNRSLFLLPAVIAFYALVPVQSFGQEQYQKEVVCRFNSKDLSVRMRRGPVNFMDLDEGYLRFDVDENENVYFLDRTSILKVFNSKGGKIREVTWNRKYNKKWNFFARQGKILFYVGYRGFTCDTDGAHAHDLNFDDYLETPRLRDGVLFNIQTGKTYHNFSRPLSPGALDSIQKHYVKNGTEASTVFTTPDQAHSTQVDYEGYHWVDIETMDKNGNLFLYYGKPAFPGMPHNDPRCHEMRYRLYKFDKNLNPVYFWDADYGLFRVNEDTGKVYQLEITKDYGLQLVRWSETK